LDQLNGAELRHPPVVPAYFVAAIAGRANHEKVRTVMFGLNLGAPELIVVGLIALLLFGNRVPAMMRSLGRGLSEFKKGVTGIQDEIRSIEESPPSA
jgi:TatA/E family protein of Tat protein translocase